MLVYTHAVGMTPGPPVWRTIGSAVLSPACNLWTSPESQALAGGQGFYGSVCAGEPVTVQASFPSAAPDLQ